MPQSRHLKFKLFLAKLALYTERLTYAFFPVLILSFFILGLGLTGMLGLFGSLGSKILVLVLLLLWLRVFFHNLKSFKAPTASDIDSRLESDNSLKHNPLFTLKDRLSEDSSQQKQNMWLIYRKKLESQTERKLRIAPPSPRFSYRDPFALGIFAVLLMIVGFIMAGHNWETRLKTSFFPFGSTESDISASPLTITFTPPSYIRKSPAHYTGPDYEKNIQVPEGTVIKAIYNTPYFKPALKVDGETIPFTEIDRNTYSAQTELTETTTVKISQLGFARARIKTEIIPDKKPKIRLSGSVERVGNGNFVIPIVVNDDYGIDKIILTGKLTQFSDQTALGEEIYEENIVALQTNGEEIELSERFDLTSHFWAGHKVMLKVGAQDSKGQITYTDEFSYTLPERQFLNPFAQKIVQNRRKLVNASLFEQMEVADSLMRLRNSIGSYNGDKVVFLALTSASRRLAYTNDKSVLPQVINTLWDTALRVEEGGLGTAMRQLKENQQKLLETLNDPNSSVEQKMAAMQKLQESMEQFWSEFMKEMQERLRQGEKIPEITNLENIQEINPGKVNDFMEQMMEEISKGNTEAAMKMAQQLQNMMGMMSSDMMPSMPKEARDIAQAMENLSDLIEQQKGLIEKSKGRAGANKPNSEMAGNGSSSPQQDAGQQSAMAGQLQALTDKLGTAGMPINTDEQTEAMSAMREAAARILNEQYDNALSSQNSSLRYMEDLQQNLMQSLKQAMQRSGGLPFGLKGQKRDIFGRPQDGAGVSYEEVEIPDEMKERNLQDILNIIRERASETQRPLDERDYYKRLLRQW